MTRRHRLIVVNKTAWYSFYLPVALAMRLAGLTSPSDPGAPSSSHADPFAAARDILIPLGEYFQVQDDYLDCYADPDVLGKVGTDILDNKCSWNINTALKYATPEQRAVLDVRPAMHAPGGSPLTLFRPRPTTVGRARKQRQR